MKILLCHNAYQLKGGEDHVVAAEHQLLLDHGHEVILWTLDNDAIASVVGKIKTGLRVSYSESSKHELISLIRKHQPNIVHVHNFFPLMTPSVYDACLEERVPVVQTLHNYRLFCANGLLLRKGKVCELCLGGNPYQAVKHQCYRHSALQSFAVARMIHRHRKQQTFVGKVSRFIVLTEFAKKKFVEYGLPDEKITVKPNFLVDQTVTSQSVVRDPTVLFVGRLSEEKGIETLLSIAKKSDLTIKVIGGGPLRDQVQSCAAIDYLGELTKGQVAEQMRKAAVLVMPSICYEAGFPLVLMEAMQSGLPIVATDLGGMAEIIEHNKTGLKVPSNNPQAFIQAIKSLMTDKTRWQSMSEAGKRLVDDRYRAEENARQLLAIYKDVINEYP